MNTKTRHRISNRPSAPGIDMNVTSITYCRNLKLNYIPVVTEYD
jgi:hypothetical protein